MPKGSFVVFRDKENTRDIHFQLASAEAKPTEAELRLRDDIDRTNTALKVLFLSEEVAFEEYFRPLLSLAQTGLVGEAAQPELAARALASLKADILAREAGRIKNAYMRRLGVAAGISGLISILVAGVIRANFIEQTVLQHFCWLWTGCMAGVWISFGARKAQFEFEDLQAPEKDFLAPAIRVVFTGLLTVTIGLLFSTSAVVVEIGKVSTAHFTQDIQIALLLGLLCGVGEQLLSSKVSSQAANLLNFGTTVAK